jgi:hypothetical protein
MLKRSIGCAALAALVVVWLAVVDVQAKEIHIPNFATDPSGSGFSIVPIIPSEGRSSNIASAPTLTYGVTDPTGMVNTMRMNWSPFVGGDEPARAGWALVFGIDPDVRNHVLTMNINPPGLANPQNPAGLANVEVVVVDANKNRTGWGFNTDQWTWVNAPPPAPGWVPLANDPFAALAANPAPIVPPPPVAPPFASMSQNFMHQVTINFGNGPVPGSATVVGAPGFPGGLTGPNYLINPGPGSAAILQNAVSIEFYENGNLRGNMAVPINGPAGLNNYWNNINLAPVPEPSTFVLLGAGALGLLAYVWRRRARTR